MNTEQIFKLAITENDETGQTYGLSHGTSKSIAGCCNTSAQTEGEFVLSILDFANNFSDELKNQINELNEHNFCENKIEDSDFGEDDRIRIITLENDIKILQSMLTWNCNIEKLKEIAHQDWQNLVRNKSNCVVCLD